VAEGDLRRLDQETVSPIIGYALLGADLAMARGAHAQGKKRRVEAHSLEDGSGENGHRARRRITRSYGGGVRC